MKKWPRKVQGVTSATDTIKLLELQRSKFVTGEKYLQAAEVVFQITEWRGKQRKLQAELSKLQKADAQGQSRAENHGKVYH